MIPNTQVRTRGAGTRSGADLSDLRVQVFGGVDSVACRMRTLTMAHINASRVVGLLQEVLATCDPTPVVVDRALSTLQQCVIVREIHRTPTVPLDLLDVFTCDSIVNSLLHAYPRVIVGRTVQELVTANLLVALSTAVTAPRVASTLFSRFVELLQYDYPVCRAVVLVCLFARLMCGPVTTGSDTQVTCPYFQSMLHRLFLRHACAPFIEPFFGAEAPVDRLLAVLGEIVHDPHRHEDIVMPALLVFEDVLQMHSTPQWGDVVLFEQCMQVLVQIVRQRRSAVLQHTAVATVHMLLRNYTGGLSRSVCADTLALCQDSITIPLGLEVLELLLETHGAALGALGLWRPAMAVLAQLVHKHASCPRFCRVVVSVLRRAVRRANYFIVQQMCDCLPAVSTVLQGASSVLRTKGLEFARILALRVRDADRAALVGALRSSGVCAAVMQRAQAIALCPPCLREIKAVLAIMGTIARLQLGSRVSACSISIYIALVSWRHPRANALLHVSLMECLISNVDTLYTTEHKIRVSDIVRIVQVLGTGAGDNIAVRARMLDLYSRLVRTYSITHPGGVYDIPPDTYGIIVEACTRVMWYPTSHSYTCFWAAVHLLRKLTVRLCDDNTMACFPTRKDICESEQHFRSFIADDSALLAALRHLLACAAA